MGASEGNEVRKFVRQAMGERLKGRGKREDGERASAGRVPVDTDVFLQKINDPAVNFDTRESLTPEQEIRLVSQALLETLMFSIPYSFFPVWPKTWLT